MKILSLTVTEKGYCLTEEGVLDVENADVRADIANFSDAKFKPNSAVGLIAKVLEVRKSRGLTPLTIMSCDNLPMNGTTTKRAVLAFAKAVSSSLESYVSEG